MVIYILSTHEPTISNFRDHEFILCTEYKLLFNRPQHFLKVLKVSFSSFVSLVVLKLLRVYKVLRAS